MRYNFKIRIGYGSRRKISIRITLLINSKQYLYYILYCEATVIKNSTFDIILVCTQSLFTFHYGLPIFVTQTRTYTCICLIFFLILLLRYNSVMKLNQLMFNASPNLNSKRKGRKRSKFIKYCIIFFISLNLINNEHY